MDGISTSRRSEESTASTALHSRSPGPTAVSSNMKRHLIALWLVIAAWVGLANAAAPSTPLSVVRFNVLAPVWASPVWYPPDMDPSLLDREVRRDRLVAVLDQLAETAAVFFPPEGGGGEFRYF